MYPEVEQFAAHMARKLEKKKPEADWKDCSPIYLGMRLVQEVGELYAYLMEYEAERVEGNTTPLGMQYMADCVRGECCDVANFAMMVADVVGALEDDSEQQEKP